MTGKKLILDTTLKAIADAIRTKTGKSAKMTPANMPAEIESITTGYPEPTGTKQVQIFANGVVTENVKDYETAQIEVSVSGGGGDESPIVILAPSGPKTAQSATVKTNGSTTPTSISGLFSGWGQLTTADLSDLIAEHITDISNLFTACESLPSVGSIILPSGNFPAVQNAQAVFSSCRFTTLNPTRFIAGAQDISYMSDFNPVLETVQFDVGCLSDVITADGIFCECEQLQALDFSATSMKSVQSMKSAFSGCMSLTTVNFSNCDFSHITVDPDEGTGFDRIFEGCTALENIIMDNSVRFPDCDIDLSATEVLTAQSLQNIYNALPQSQAGATLSLHKTVYESTDPNIISMIESKGWAVKSVDPDEENW